MPSKNTPRIFLITADRDHINLLSLPAFQALEILGEKSCWIYLGRDYNKLLRWQTSLAGKIERINYGHLLQEIGMKFRKPFTSWIQEHSESYGDSLSWWSSRIAELNTGIDSLFHKICYLEIGLTTARAESRSLVIVSESLAVLKTIASDSELGPRCIWANPGEKRLVWFRWLLSLARVWAFYLYESIKELREARVTKQGLTGNDRCSDKPTVLIHTWVDESCLGQDGELLDRYFTALPDELRKTGYRVVTIPCLYNISRSKKKAFQFFRRRPERYLIPEDYYTFADYVWAACVVISQAWLLPGNSQFQDLDTTELVREACREQSKENSAARFILYHKLVQKLKRSGYKINIFIDTFENMLSEKPQIMAFRKYMPKTRTVGFQHYIAPYPLWLCLLSAPAQGSISYLPDIIVCNSPWTAAILAKEGFPAERLRIGPSLRYLHLLDSSIHEERPGKAVLVVLPFDNSASAELMKKLIVAFPDQEQIEFMIKPHPMTASTHADSINEGKLPSHMREVRGSMADVFPKAACAVVIASTSALEIALAGVPVIVVGRETDFDMNPLAWFPEFQPPVHTPDELRERVLAALSPEENEHTSMLEWASKARQDYFSPLNADTIKTFVEPIRAR